jgi:hypothetical protein
MILSTVSIYTDSMDSDTEIYRDGRTGRESAKKGQILEIIIQIQTVCTVDRRKEIENEKVTQKHVVRFNCMCRTVQSCTGTI